MKSVLAALCVSLLLPVAASAEEGSQRARCLEKAAREELAVTERIAQLEKLDQTGLISEYRYIGNSSMYALGAPMMRNTTITGINGTTTGGITPDASFPPGTSLSDRRLLLAQRDAIPMMKLECAQLPETREVAVRRASTSRGGVVWKSAHPAKAKPDTGS